MAASDRIPRMMSDPDATPPESPGTGPGTGKSARERPVAAQIDHLYSALGGAKLPPRTRKLSSASMVKKAKKMMEEANELAFEAVLDRKQGVIQESADVIYHMVVLWRACGVKPAEIWREMHERVESLGVAEKRPKR